MKKIAYLGLAAALALAALAPRRAAAQCCAPPCERGGEINFNVGFTFGCHWTPCHGQWVPNCPVCYAPPAPYGYPPPPPPPVGYGYPPPPPAAIPNTPGGPNPLPKGPPSGLQNVGYSYTAGHEAGYGYGYASPYGIPYFQTPDYWYGR